MSKQLSRRDFLKGSAAAGLGLAATLGLGGVAFADEAKYKAGTYQATAYGNLSYVTVECTFSETALEKVDIISQNETPILFSQVQDKLIPAIVENQALGLDSITGASNSSRAVKEAIADCVAQAGGDPEEWLGRTVEKVAGSDETYDVDICVIGCGGSGFMASSVQASWAPRSSPSRRQAPSQASTASRFPDPLRLTLPSCMPAKAARRLKSTKSSITL